MAAVFKLYGEDMVVANEKLGRLAQAIILESPLVYGKWLAKAFIQGTYQVIFSTYGRCWIRISFDFTIYIFGLLIMLTDVVLLLSAARYGNGKGIAVVFNKENEALSLLGVIALVGILFYFFSLGLVVLVQPPIERFAWPAAVFTPSIFFGVVVWKWQIVRAIWSAARNAPKAS